jgi:hypothetical protein
LVKIGPKYVVLLPATNSPLMDCCATLSIFFIVDSVMWLNEIENELLIFRCNNAYPIAPQLHFKWCTEYVVYFLTTCSADTRKGAISGTLFNPSFTDWVQNIPSRGIFLNNSR